MKKFGIVISLVLALALVLPLSVSAALPGTGWQTSYQLMNIGTVDGLVSMQAFSTSGSTPVTVGSATFTVGALQALSYVPAKTPTYPAGPDIGFTTPLPSGFQGSVVVSASVPVASAVTLSNASTARSRYAAISASGLANTVIFPSVKHNFAGQTTTFYIQAAGEAASATITYKMANGTTHTQMATIEANKTFIFDPALATPPVASSGCGGDSNTSPCFGAATVVSTTGKIAGVVVESPHTTSPAPFVLSTRGLTSSDLSNKLYAPSVKNNYLNSNSGLTLMNTGTGTAKVNYTITVNNVQSGSPAALAGVVPGQQFTGSIEILAGKSAVIGPYTVMGGMPQGTYASIMAESVADGSHAVQILAGMSNESRDASVVGGKAKAMYYAFNPSSATTNVACPVIKENVLNQTGGMTAVNLSASAAVLHFEYVLYGGQTYHFWTTQPVPAGAGVATNSVSINPGGRFTNDGSWLFSVLSGKTFSVRVYSADGGPIVALSQETAKDYSNDIRNYECYNY